MSLFICAKCECIENSAFGLWASRNNPEWYKWDEVGVEYKGKPLCSECMPRFYINGTPHGRKWHDRFVKEHYTIYLKKNPKAEIVNLFDYMKTREDNCYMAEETSNGTN